MNTYSYCAFKALKPEENTCVIFTMFHFSFYLLNLTMVLSLTEVT